MDHALAECAAFETASAACPGAFADRFTTVPSPGIIATTMENRHYGSHETYLFVFARPLKVDNPDRH